ncbi:MAG: type II secretion system minor pseudopilin GspK [Candidatus Binataceae bacterium]
MRRLRKTERGIALLATMLGMALMTVVVMDFTTASTLGFRSAANQANQMRAEYLGLSGVNVGMALLAQDARQDAALTEQQPHDGFDKLWAQPFPPIPVGGGLAGVSIVDENRKLDLNLIIGQNGTVNLPFVQILVRLFAVSQIPPEILPAIINWIGVPGSPFPPAAGADYYLRLTPPYAPRNGPIPTIGDLRMVRGVNDVIFNELSQFLTVVQTQQAGNQQLPMVNVNTAPPEVLASLTQDMTDNPNLVKEIIAARTAKPFLDTASVAELAGSGNSAGDLPGLLTVRSDYFTIAGRGTYAGARKIVVAIVHREGLDPLQVISCYED